MVIQRCSDGVFSYSRNFHPLTPVTEENQVRSTMDCSCHRTHVAPEPAFCNTSSRPAAYKLTVLPRGSARRELYLVE